MRSRRYNKSADSYSFGISLCAMIRADTNVQEYMKHALRKSLKRAPNKTVGMSILTNRLYNKVRAKLAAKRM